MIRQICCLAFMVLGANSLHAQKENYKGHRNFPIIVSLQFHALATPFRDFKTHFQHIGLGLGTEISLNNKHNWAQQFQALFIPNKQVGNRFQLSSRCAWRPQLGAGIFAEINTGLGFQYAWRPVNAFRMEANEWISSGKKGKTMLLIPLGLSLGYNAHRSETYLNPYAGYQVLLLVGYNPSVPIVTESLFQLGASIHPE